MYKLQTQIEFEAAHRLYDVDTYSEECRNNIQTNTDNVSIIIAVSIFQNSSDITIVYAFVVDFGRCNRLPVIIFIN